MATPSNSKRNRLSQLRRNLLRRSESAERSSFDVGGDHTANITAQKTTESDESSTIENLRKEVLELKRKLQSCPPIDTNCSAQSSDKGKQIATGHSDLEEVTDLPTVSPSITADSATPSTTPSSATPPSSLCVTSPTRNNSTATSLSLIESNGISASGRTDLLISVGNRLLDLSTRLENLLNDRQTITKIGGGLPACLMGSYHADGSGQDLKGFVRNSLALGENRFELQNSQPQFAQHKFAVAENRLRLAVDRLALIFDRLIGTCNRTALKGHEDALLANRKNIHGVITKILYDSSATVLDHSWTRQYLRGLIAFYRDEASRENPVQDAKPVISAPVQHLHELLSRTSTRNRDSHNSKPRGSARGPESRSHHAKDGSYCPACHPSTKFDILKLDTELKHTEWKRKCRLCKRVIESDFVRETVISLAVRRK